MLFVKFCTVLLGLGIGSILLAMLLVNLVSQHGDKCKEVGKERGQEKDARELILEVINLSTLIDRWPFVLWVIGSPILFPMLAIANIIFVLLILKWRFVGPSWKKSKDT